MTTRSIRLAKDLTLPLDVVTQTIAILAKRRAGKSYTMRRLAEQLFQAAQQIVLVDPKGDQWGIRSSADGKAEGLRIVILGGERGDVPLEASSGEVVAKLVVEERVSVLIDLSTFRKHEVATFMTAFLENVYRLKAKEIYRTPVMLVIDEADAVAPQKPQKGEERMLGAAEDIVRRGGQRGIGCVLVTQRSAVLNKNVLTQAQMLVALRTIAPQDLAAMDAWIQVHGTPEQRKTLMESLPSLPVGDAWFWSPGWPTVDGIFQRVHVLPIETFDSGATPKPGEKRIEPKTAADVDLDALKRQMAATIEKAKADDPRELRRQIAELKKQVARGPAQANPKKEQIRQPKTIDRFVLKDGQLARLEKAGESIGELSNRLFDLTEKVQALWKDIRAAVAQTRQPLPSAVATPRQPARQPVPAQASRSVRTVVQAVDRGDGSLGKGERQILIAIAQHDAGVTREQLTVLTGYKRSSRDTYLQRLLQRGLIGISGSDHGRLITSDAGVDALGSDYEPLPTGDELRAYWLERLPEGERKILELLARHYPDVVDRERLSDATGYKRSSRDTYLQRLSARRLITTEGRGAVRASEELFS